MNTYSFSKHERRYQVDGFDTTIIQVNDKTRMDEHGHYRSKDTLIIKPIKRWVIEPAEFKKETEPILTYNANALWYLSINSIKELDSVMNINNNENKNMISLLQSQITEQQSVIDSLSILIKNQEARIARLEAQNNINRNEVSDIILEQNNPNPFSDQTTITYYIPENVTGTPELIITASSQSQILKKIDLRKGTPTQLTVSAADFNTGVYVYSIIIENQVLASKKFIIIK
jgi:uncharacterized coiled-coil protein SlyX